MDRRTHTLELGCRTLSGAVKPFRKGHGSSLTLHPLHLAKQVAQSVVLAGELIALFDELRFLGPLGIPLGPGGQHQDAQRRNIVGEGIGRRHARIISSRQRRTILNLKVSQHDAALAGQGAAQPATCGRLIRGAYTRLQSSPSNNAANCAADSRMTPSLIAGHLNLAPSSRFQISTRPVPS